VGFFSVDCCKLESKCCIWVEKNILRST
jgi:hypothetical protein